MFAFVFLASAVNKLAAVAESRGGAAASVDLLVAPRLDAAKVRPGG